MQKVSTKRILRKWSRILILMLIVFHVQSFAQENDPSVFVSPIIKLQTINNRSSFCGGARLGLNLTDRFSLGGGFYSSLNSIPFNLGNTQNGTMSFTMGGLELGFSVVKIKPIKITLLMLAGSGGLSYSSQIKKSSEDFLIWEPEILVEIKCLDWLIFNVGTGYRFITFTGDHSQLPATDLKGLSGVLGIKFVIK